MHRWRFLEGTWRCAICATWVGTHRRPGKYRREKCQGQFRDARLKYFSSRGHRLCRTEGEIPIVFCSRCGGWSSRRPRKLKRQCEAATAPGKQALARLAKGMCPWTKRTNGGEQGGRSRLRVTATYNENEGGWQEHAGRGAKRSHEEMEAGDAKSRGTEAAAAQSEPEIGQQNPRKRGGGADAAQSPEGSASISRRTDEPGTEAQGAMVHPLAMMEDVAEAEWQRYQWEDDQRPHPQDMETYTFEADEEVAATMGWGFDLDRHQHPHSTVKETAVPEDMADKMDEHSDNGIGSATGRPGSSSDGAVTQAASQEHRSHASRRASGRNVAKDKEAQITRTATKRAIEAIGERLKRGPRDGAERLEALKKRIRNKLEGKEAKGQQESTRTRSELEGEMSQQETNGMSSITDNSGEGAGSASSTCPAPGMSGVTKPFLSPCPPGWQTRRKQASEEGKRDGGDGMSGLWSGEGRGATDKERAPRGTSHCEVGDRARSVVDQKRKDHGSQGEEAAGELAQKRMKKGGQHNLEARGTDEHCRPSWCKQRREAAWEEIARDDNSAAKQGVG